MAGYSLDGCRLEISAPVEVGRASGHHWFSTLHPIEGSDILCEVVVTDDKAQGKWPAWLYLSRDGGRSWDKVCEIDSYGPSSVSLTPRKILLMPYEVWPLSLGDRRNAAAEGTIVTCTDEGAVITESTSVRFLGFPRDLADYHEGELLLLTNGNVLRLEGDRLFTTLYGRFMPHTENHQYDCVAVVSEDGGFTWRYLSHVASWQDTPGASEGPDESNTARLPDGRLMCVYRVGSGREHHYQASYSPDDGQTWSKPKCLANAWSVEPQLVCLENGTLLLSGGRPGLMLWVCTDGRGEKWQPLNLAEHHNAACSDPTLHFEADCVAAARVGAPSYTTSYTGMKAVGPDEVMISYDRLGNGWHGAPGLWGTHDVVFTIRIRVF